MSPLAITGSWHRLDRGDGAVLGDAAVLLVAVRPLHAPAAAMPAIGDAGDLGRIPVVHAPSRCGSSASTGTSRP